MLALEVQRPDGTWHQHRSRACLFESHEDAIRTILAISPDWTIPSWIRVAEVTQ
ncbi:hypothetical protein ACIKTA_06875 [Hansschlegelia beijingensis]